MKTDRRIQKTKKLLTDSLIRLMLKKNFAAITVQDILDEANVGRSTFYTHYENKEQLLLEGHANLNVRLFEKDANGALNFLPLFEHISGHRELARALLGDHAGNIMMTFLKNNAAAMIRNHFAPHFGKATSARYRLRYLSEAAASAVTSLIGCWIGDDFFLSAADIAHMCDQSVHAVFKAETPI